MTLLSANNYNNRSYTQFFALLLSLVFGFLSLETQALEAGADYCFYDKKQFKGESVCGNKAQSPWLGFKWAGRVSSLQVAEGKEIVVYEYPWQLGAAEVFSADVSKLTSGWNNRIVSFKMRPKMPAQDKVCFYKKPDYRGKRLCTNDSTSLISFGWYGKVKSISIPAGKQVTLYKSWFYRGSAELVASSKPKLRGNSKKFASFKIEDTNSNTDADSDGVNDTDDLCPNTLLGEVVNSDGCALTQLDTDSDGVNDAIDQCPSTPVGETANDNGCALTQLDSDNDSVSDAIDQCPNTPQGETVNTEGCSLSQIDTDNDGVSDALDQCSDTVAGESVNANGCSLTQLDSDNDGLNDALDQCPNTPAGEPVNANGCSTSQIDSDSDGVSDAIDQCPNTLAGQSVNANGCALTQLDTDNDGLNDAIDQCPATPAGETVNGEGCALSQLDADNDGASDAVDICPNTPVGESVNNVGCSLTQLDTDNDGVNDAIDQCSGTPNGETANADGCALTQLDSDEDGANDAIDQCPNTPAGEAPNSDGCAPSQLDTDNDSVNDAIDQCPNTVGGVSVNGTGCSLSQLDSDGDGVSDAVDRCANTAVGEETDAYGCSLNQIDTDTDGTPDYLDAFPDDATESTDLDGDGIGDNADTDLDGDGIENAADLFPVDATEWADLDGDGIGDNTDEDRDGDGVNNVDDYFPDDASASTVPIVQITSPNTLTTVGSSPLRIAGTINDDTAVVIINGVEIAHSGGLFEADVALEEGANNIVVRAIDERSHEGTATISVSLDKTPPYITVRSPEDGSTVYTDMISVSGLVNDIVRGTVSADEAAVVVTANTGSQTASVSNRSYLAENIQLQMGANTITITATDAVGNTGTHTLSVSYEPQTDKKITLVSGQAQTIAIQEILAQPLIVNLTENDIPVVDKTVIFRVIEGDGLLQPGTTSEGNGAIVTTDAQGNAHVSFKVGTRAGTGNHKVVAKAVGYKGDVQFYHSASYGDGIQMGIIAGNNQRGSIKQPLPQPLTLAVTDGGANLIPNAEIEFEVTQGSGTFNNGETLLTTTTDMDGRASVSFVLGSEEGLDVHRITARLIGTPATSGFTASAFMPGDPGDTSITGVVLDNQDQPIPNVTVRIEGSTRQAITDDQGLFKITEAPVGPVHILVEGSTTTREGEWPSLSYNIVTIPGVENPMASPVFLVKIDTENAVFVGAEDIVVTHPDIPGFKLDVKAGSVTFPDGAKEGYLSITPVNANKIPMPPPNGMQPQLIVTIQPHGAKFDPPAPLTIPNTDGHAPLAEIEMYSYDHDLEEFVTIGLGTVSKDGATVSSNVGSGVIKAGWHCGSQPGGSGCCEQPPADEECGYCEDYESGENCSAGSCKSVDDRVAEEQTEGNCQKELCSGSEDDPTDEPPEECGTCDGGEAIVDEDIQLDDDKQEPNDCLTLYCGGRSEPADETDAVQAEEECKYCLRGSKVNVPYGDGCGDGSAEQSCYTCSRGSCGNNCEASSNKSTTSINVEPDIVSGALDKITNGLDQLPYVDASLSTKLTASKTSGEECCGDCGINNGKPAAYEETEVQLGISGSVTAIIPGTGLDLDMPEITINGIGKAQIDLIFGLGGEGAAAGGIAYSGKESGCEENVCRTVQGGIRGNVRVGVIANGSARLSACLGGSDVCQTILGAEIKGHSAFNLPFSISDKAYYGSCAANSCTTAYLGAVSFSTAISGELIFPFFSFLYTATTPEIKVLDATSIGSCK